MYYRQEYRCTQQFFSSDRENKLNSFNFSSEIMFLKSSLTVFNFLSLEHIYVILETQTLSHYFI